MKIQLVWGLCILGASQISAADNGDSQTPALNPAVLDNKRLFFSQEQRRAGIDATPGARVLKPPLMGQTSSTSVSAGASSKEPALVLRYNGVIRSDRGIRVLINGALWHSGMFGVVRALIQQNTNTLEIQTDTGNRYRLRPGQSVELVP